MEEFTHTTDTLRKLQITQFQLLLEVKRICDKHNIAYFLDGGTLLGAVRHKGFIPWDDDIDIGMLRDDYTRFLNICNNELSDDFFLQTKDTDPNFTFPFAKLRLNGTIRKDMGMINTTIHNGIDIDIFPFDNIPNKKTTQWLYYNICWLLRGMFAAKSKIIVPRRSKSVIRRFGLKICRLLSLFVSSETISTLIDLHFQKYNNIPTENVISSAGTYHYTKEIIKKEDIISKKYLQFEREVFPVPKNYHEYLTNLYGEYMVLPPVEDRIQHHYITELNFGIYEKEIEQAVINDSVFIVRERKRNLE